MKIIDAQVHIWSQTVVPPSGLHRKVEKFTAEELLREMDEAGAFGPNVFSGASTSAACHAAIGIA